MGSNGHDLVGESLMHLLTSSSVTGLKGIESRRHQIWCITERARSGRQFLPQNSHTCFYHFINNAS